MADQTPPSDALDRFVGERLRAMRLLKGMSQTELGKAVGISFQQIQKYERGVNRISVSTLVRAANALGRSVGEFLPRDVDDEAFTEARMAGEARLLAELFAAMGTGQRAVLLDVAREFARRD